MIHTDAHFWIIFYLPQNGWVWLGGCGFGLTTLKEFAPGLQSACPVHACKGGGVMCDSGCLAALRASLRCHNDNTNNIRRGRYTRPSPRGEAHQTFPTPAFLRRMPHPDSSGPIRCLNFATREMVEEKLDRLV